MLDESLGYPYTVGYSCGICSGSLESYGTDGIQEKTALDTAVNSAFPGVKGPLGNLCFFRNIFHNIIAVHQEKGINGCFAMLDLFHTCGAITSQKILALAFAGAVFA